MTEDEAKSKWCPFSRVAETADGEHADNAAAYNRLFEVSSGRLLTDEAKCIASACMAWRETGSVDLTLTNADRVARIPTGYCGLAGGQL